MRRRPKLHFAGQNPTDVFDDLGKLRKEQAVPVRRQRAVETFARIPHERAYALYRHRVSAAAWVLLVELDRLVLKARGRNPVLLWSSALRDLGVTHNTRARALRELEAAGAVRIEKRGRGLSPMVTHLWYEQRE
jgi:hypothetical protein